MFTVSVLGVGNRGGIYAKYFSKNEGAKIVSACDIDKKNLLSLKTLCDVKDEDLFTDERAFFEKKRSDVLVIATLDHLHCRHAVRALSLGYDVLLEKPIAPNEGDMLAIQNAALQYGGKVVICHNLRYTPFYQKMKTLLTSGVLGDVLSFEQSENVAYHHFMLSFARGNWRNSATSSSIILQKCCHDLDIIYWLIGKKCIELSSFGSLRYYTKANMPKYATEKCADCPKKDCAYNAVEFCRKYNSELTAEEKTDENIRAYLDKGVNPMGACVFALDNDVCDRQIVNMTFEGGTVANLIMHGFCAPRTDRITKIYGTKGCVTGNLDSGKITVTVFGESPYEIDINDEITDKSSHLGGDCKLVADYVDYMNGKERPLGISLIEDSVYSHKLAFAAERSRLFGGKPVEV